LISDGGLFQTFLEVDNCTVDEIRRWYGGPDNKPLMSSSGISTDKAKYHTAIEKNGFILTILNLTVEYLNVSYECSITYPSYIGDLNRFWLVILFRHFGFIAPKILNYLAFKSFDFERT
jgi:hypothetical protein